ncbi:hypothetical protein [uncultured Rhodoblastus sp.]|uniref:hypothetical protein n=1 Tax=uncultured Rhodoblastus sp. TaxID=543037 RepID=UPI0025E9FA1C|nr:hypothetical protein [uncultured Rhodoblastus sp.]
MQHSCSTGDRRARLPGGGGDPTCGTHAGNERRAYARVEDRLREVLRPLAATSGIPRARTALEAKALLTSLLGARTDEAMKDAEKFKAEANQETDSILSFARLRGACPDSI